MQGMGLLVLALGLTLVILGAVIKGSETTLLKDIASSQLSQTQKDQVDNISRSAIGVIVIGAGLFIIGLIMSLKKPGFEPSAKPLTQGKYTFGLGKNGSMLGSGMGKTVRYYF